ncbi:MAG: carbohydrate kinase family protein [Planctomycetota bacterium]
MPQRKLYGEVAVQHTVLAYGETLWDLLPSGPQLGGAPFNFCYRVDELGDLGLMVTRLGRDELGRKAWDRIVALGMDTRLVQWDEEASTGTVEVDLTDPNNPDFHIVPGVAYDDIEVTDELLEAAEEADMVCFGTLIQRTARSRRTLHRALEAASEALRLLDINLRKECYTRETVARSLRRADVLKLNDDEAGELASMFGFSEPDLRGFCDLAMDRWNLSHVVVTLGEAGAFAADEAGERVHVPGFRVELVDACGSGDAFTAGFAHRLLRGRSLEECCRLGNAFGALVATHDGATTPVPLETVREFLDREHDRVGEPELDDYRTG